jgi:hypothetical protein
MRSVKHLLVACGLALALFTAGTAEAKASDTRYAAVHITNPTSIRVHYLFRWGSSNEWKRITLEPGENCLHTWEYDYVGQNSSPVPQIAFDCNLGSSALVPLQFDLKAYAVPYKDSTFAKKYRFVVRGSTLDLDSIN